MPYTSERKPDYNSRARLSVWVRLAHAVAAQHAGASPGQATTCDSHAAALLEMLHLVGPDTGRTTAHRSGDIRTEVGVNRRCARKNLAHSLNHSAVACSHGLSRSWRLGILVANIAYAQADRRHRAGNDSHTVESRSTCRSASAAHLPSGESSRSQARARTAGSCKPPPDSRGAAVPHTGPGRCPRDSAAAPRSPRAACKQCRCEAIAPGVP